MGERFRYMERVTGSIPVETTVVVAQMVRALDCGSRGHGFETHQSPHCLLGVMEST